MQMYQINLRCAVRKAVPRIFFRGVFTQKIFGWVLHKKPLKMHTKFVYIHFCYIFTNQTNISGGGVKPSNLLPWIQPWLGDLNELLYKILFNCLQFFLPNFSCRDVPGQLSRGFFSACFVLAKNKTNYSQS